MQHEFAARHARHHELDPTVGWPAVEIDHEGVTAAPAGTPSACAPIDLDIPMPRSEYLLSGLLIA